MKPVILLKIFIANIYCHFFPGVSTVTCIELVVKLLDLTHYCIVNTYMVNYINKRLFSI